MGVKFKGSNEFNKKLKDMQQKARELEQGVSVGFSDLFNESFMTAYTNFSSINHFFDKSPFKVEYESDFESIDTKQLDEFVKNQTKFSCWEDMKGAAGKEWVAKQLGL
ncbi:hypothetical protein J7E71_27690 [Mesobacillus foraminis]|uniref:hypothetical protein n=1 Tax=Mesobacillus foraminis TaxID=279826 RepID=UPI001BE8B240|nr:hypothetical protein [Mesobacillus foraminis]MBT2759621.1 hypothetical protein [Mesobacillus foraminis]